MKIWQPSVISGLYFCLKERKTPDKTLENRAICKNVCPFGNVRSEEHTSELQSLLAIAYAVFCLKKKFF